jgi:hypothetical protein
VAGDLVLQRRVTPEELEKVYVKWSDSQIGPGHRSRSLLRMCVRRSNTLKIDTLGDLGHSVSKSEVGGPKHCES